jgi:NAD(P)-dependent dehydrogenase (short-subunit alcohol dehydrogenase family)
VAPAKQCQEWLAPEQHLWELQMIQRRRGAELAATTPLALYERIALLIKNAAVTEPPNARTVDGFELTLATNHLGPFALTAFCWNDCSRHRDPGSRR